jgi:hypothetical protein
MPNLGDERCDPFGSDDLVTLHRRVQDRNKNASFGAAFGGFAAVAAGGLAITFPRATKITARGGFYQIN